MQDTSITTAALSWEWRKLYDEGFAIAAVAVFGLAEARSDRCLGRSSYTCIGFLRPGVNPPVDGCSRPHTVHCNVDRSKQLRGTTVL